MAITREPSLRIRGPWMKWANSGVNEYVTTWPIRPNIAFFGGSRGRASPVD